MTKIIGRMISFGIAKETVRGTSPAAPTYYIPFSDLDFAEKIDWAERDQAYGVIEDAVGADITKQWAEGSIKAPIGDKHFPLILLNVLGTLNTAANADGSGTVKDHTITVGETAQHTSLSFYYDDPAAGVDYSHALGMVDSLDITYERGSALSYSAKVMAKKGVVVGAGLTPAITSENRFLPQHVSFKMATTLAGLTGATAGQIKSLSISINPNVEADDVLGSVTPVDFLNRQMEIDGKFEAVWTDETYKTPFMAGTYEALRFDAVNTGVTIGTSANPRLKIDLARCLIKEVSKPIKLGDIITQSVSFKAYYDVTNTQMISVLVTNAVASY